VLSLPLEQHAPHGAPSSTSERLAAALTGDLTDFTDTAAAVTEARPTPPVPVSADERGRA
jgi:hypothetical protein